ncbi:MAG: thermonuclease family protein [Hylemonella sp.]|nr:thermonuclease family protein [Hylemonella sp.]
MTRGCKAALRMGLLAACLVASLAAPVAAQGPKSPWSGTVTHVSDGDTLWVRPQRGGAPRPVRIDGIDAPELCQSHGETARAALVGRVLGQVVQVRVRRHDDYGRALARVNLRGQDIGAWLVSQGHAWSYRYRGQSGPYAQQEGQARARRLGLFLPGRAEVPREFRRRHGPCH